MRLDERKVSSDKDEMSLLLDMILRYRYIVNYN